MDEEAVADEVATAVWAAMEALVAGMPCYGDKYDGMHARDEPDGSDADDVLNVGVADEVDVLDVADAVDVEPLRK